MEKPQYIYQAPPTEKVKEKCTELLDYIATYPNVFLRYSTSNTTLHVDSDATYLITPKARSRITGYYFQQYQCTAKSNPSKTSRYNWISLPSSCCQISCRVRNLSNLSQLLKILSLRILLHALHHSQPPTPLKTDNTTANSFVHHNIHLRKSKT